MAALRRISSRLDRTSLLQNLHTRGMEDPGPLRTHQFPDFEALSSLPEPFCEISLHNHEIGNKTLVSEVRVRQHRRASCRPPPAQPPEAAASVCDVVLQAIQQELAKRGLPANAVRVLRGTE